MIIEKFNPENISYIVERVFDLWKPPSDDEAFKRIYVEGIIRQNCADNDMLFQATENGNLCAVIFAENKDEENSSSKWWNEQYSKLTEYQKMQFEMCREYLTLMDKKTFSYMNCDDVKLSLFVSIERGAGKIILKNAMDFFKSRGYKNMYLWTDCECNVGWYFEKGFSLIEESVYDKYSKDGYQYLTYVFKKSLS